MEDAGETFNGLSQEALASYLDAAYYLGWGEYFVERFDHAIRHLERGVAVSRRTGQGRLLVAMMLVLALAQVARGRVAQALDLAEAGLEASHLTGGPQALSYALRVRCWVALMAGDLETAVRTGQEALQQARLVDQSIHGVAAGWRFAAALLEAGEPTRAREVILGTGGGPNLPLSEPGQRCMSYEVLTRAELAVGRVAAARQWAERGEEAGRELSCRWRRPRSAGPKPPCAWPRDARPRPPSSRLLPRPWRRKSGLSSRRLGRARSRDEPWPSPGSGRRRCSSSAAPRPTWPPVAPKASGGRPPPSYADWAGGYGSDPPRRSGSPP